MPAGPRQQALRRLAAVVKRLAQQHRLGRAVVHADASVQDVARVYKRLCKLVHPDKGGDAGDFRDLDSAYKEWKRMATGGGANRDKHCNQSERDTPPSPPTDGTPHCAIAARAVESEVRPPQLPLQIFLAEATASRAVFRINCCALMLTYSFGRVGVAIWAPFVAHVRLSRKSWRVLHWCATLEGGDNVHAHLMLQFNKKVDTRSSVFAFNGVRPNVRPSRCDLLGEGFATKSPQTSIDRGFFYVWADKIGTLRSEHGEVCVDGDYAPLWTTSRKTYKVLRRWAQALWESRKLSHDTYDELLFATRQGVLGAKRNLEAVRSREEEIEEENEMKATVARIRGDPELYKPFLRIPAADEWLQLFQTDALRFPMLVVLGQSGVGKTEWAKSLFGKALELKIGNLSHFPEKMRLFSRRQHNAVVLDDVRDMEFLAQHQHVLQGKYDERVEFASTPGGQCAYRRWLFKIPFVATVNYSTANLDHLRTHDWLNKSSNVVLVELSETPVVHALGPAALATTPADVPLATRMSEWSVNHLRSFLLSQGLPAIAEVCYASGVDGADLRELDSQTARSELRLTSFQAKKLLVSRDAFLNGLVSDGRSGR